MKILNIINLKKIFFIVFGLFFSLTNICQAGSIISNTTDITNQASALQISAGFGKTTSVADIISFIIKGFLSLLGVIFIILIILAGYNWMTAAGDEQKVATAKDTIKTAIIGLIIIVAAYSITGFVFKNLPWGNTP